MSPGLALGAEPERNWCYYYEKIDLAMQLNDWRRAVELSDQARQLGFNVNRPGSNAPHEWLPVIEAYIHSNRWQDVLEISPASYEWNPAYRDLLCSRWQAWTANSTGVTGIDETFVELAGRLKCPAYP